MTGIGTNTMVGILLVAAALAGCGGDAAPSGDGRPSTPSTTAAAPARTAPANTDAPGATDALPTVSVSTGAAPTPPESAPRAPKPSEDVRHDGKPAGQPRRKPADPAPAPAALRGVSLVEHLVVRDEPGGAEVVSLPARTAFDTPMVVGVREQVGAWVEIQVPIRPNDLTGWVRAADLELEPVYAEIHVDLASRTLRLVEEGELTGEWTVAVGRSDRPTPTGSFYITDKVATGDPNSVWGAHAFGLSAYSDVLTDFIGGNGQIGLHGTNDPTSIGREASSGCIRLPNEVIDELIHRLPLGTPVLIT